MQHQLADVDVDVLRDVGRQTLDFDLAADEVDDAALLLDALRLALEDDRHRDREQLVHRDGVEVGVEQLVVDRIELVLLDQHLAARRQARAFEPDQRVDAGLRVQDAQQHLRVDRDLRRLVLLGAVDDRGNAPRRAQAARLVLAAAVSLSQPEVLLPYQFLSYQLPTLPAPGPTAAELRRTAKKPMSLREYSESPGRAGAPPRAA